MWQRDVEKRHSHTAWPHQEGVWSNLWFKHPHFPGNCSSLLSPWPQITFYMKHNSLLGEADLRLPPGL